MIEWKRCPAVYIECGIAKIIMFRSIETHQDDWMSNIQEHDGLPTYRVTDYYTGKWYQTLNSAYHLAH